MTGLTREDFDKDWMRQQSEYPNLIQERYMGTGCNPYDNIGSLIRKQCRVHQELKRQKEFV